MCDKQMLEENLTQKPHKYVSIKIHSNPSKPCRLKTKIIITFLLALALVSIFTGYLIYTKSHSMTEYPSDPIEPRIPSVSKLHVFKRAAACSDAPICSEVGKTILAQNGSAVDSAIASMFCNGLLNQQSTGLGGGFFMTVYIKEEGKAYSVIARESAPAAATSDMFKRSVNKSSEGALAVAVPGQVRGLWAAYLRWGKLPWASLVSPAIEICKEGFPLSQIVLDALLIRSQQVKNDANLRQMYVDPRTDDFYKVGNITKPSQVLCETLATIAANGGDELYNGSLSMEFLKDLHRVGSVITADDLRNYQPKITEPLAVPFGDGDTLFTPPPPGGGLVLISILSILSGYRFNSSSIATTEDKILSYHRIIEAFKYSYALRSKLGDADFLDLDEIIANVTSPEYGEEIRLKIDDNKTSYDSALYGAETYAEDDSGTAHLSILAENGDAVSITSSVDLFFGAVKMCDKQMLEESLTQKPHKYVSIKINSNPSKPCRLKTKIIITLLLALALVSIFTGYLIYTKSHFTTEEPSDSNEPRIPSVSKLRVFKRAAACSDAPICSEVGKTILAQNGSAVDSAIASMFCNGLLNQQSTGLGGGFFMTVYIKEEGKAYSVIARESAPAAATTDMFKRSVDKSSEGALAVAVPGQVRGLWAAYLRWGKLPWASLLFPAIEICKEGFPLSQIVLDALHERSQQVKNDANLRKMYVDPTTDDFYKVGDITKPSEVLCETLAIIAAKGGDELYNGSLSMEFLKDLHRVGSIITADDLQNYQPKITEPLAVPFGDGDTLFTPPPPGGGLVLISILSILSGYRFNSSSIASTEDKILSYHRIIEAFKYSYALRSKLGDADFLNLDEIIANVTSPEYGEEIRLKIDDNKTSNDSALYGAEAYAEEDSGTAHLSILAENGDAVSVTSSVDLFFGAGFSTHKTGIVMNDVMDDFSSPGITNAYNLKPSRANYIVPRKRPLSSMTPSILVDTNKNVKLVIGSSGGTRIPTSAALVAIGKLWFGQSIKEAIDEPRVHHQLFPMYVSYEYGLQDAIVKGLRAKGHKMVRYTTIRSVNCSLYRNSTAIYGNADFRKAGDVCGLN
ncbi:putative gamma glutamyl transpeptidase [Operophtera brumata]|uniref:Putative gamma glutamyl transpeptidase n=1 Tax=Operophtera brumata TaxID=104452 RepID=A0A0L7KS97_OPEBR|nr:putative gamma glutamyl transpeptidase [Operophtera brumata]